MLVPVYLGWGSRNETVEAGKGKLYRLQSGGVSMRGGSGRGYSRKKIGLKQYR